MPVLESFQTEGDIRIKAVDGSGVWMRTFNSDPGYRIVFSYHHYITSKIYPAHSRILGVNTTTGLTDIYSFVKPGRR